MRLLEALTPSEALDDPRRLEGLEQVQLEERYLCFGRDYDDFNETLRTFLCELEEACPQEQLRDLLLVASSKHPANHRLQLLVARIHLAEGDWRLAQRVLLRVKPLLETHDEL
eukprot:746704-Hanusia_phi.AAC.8